MFVVQVTDLSPLSSYPTLQLRVRTVPVETGNFLSAFMLVQDVFKPVQSEVIKVTIMRLIKSLTYQHCRFKRYLITPTFLNLVFQTFNLLLIRKIIKPGYTSLSQRFKLMILNSHILECLLLKSLLISVKQ